MAIDATTIDENAALAASQKSAKRWRGYGLGIGLTLISLIYVLQMASPLRLLIDPDSVVLLELGGSLADGKGLLSRGQPTHYPAGYPAMVACLDLLGIASSATLIGMNLFFLGIGMLAAYRLFRGLFGWSHHASLTCCVLTLMSWPLFWYTLVPLSDVPFFGISLAACWAIYRGECSSGWRRWLWIAIATALGVLALETRTIGIALFPAIIGVALGERGKALAMYLAKPPRLWLVLVVLAGLVAVGAAYVFTSTRYGQEAMCSTDYQGDGGWIGLVGWVLLQRVMELGSLGTNVQNFKIFEPQALWFAPPGAVVCVLLCIGFKEAVWRRWSSVWLYCLGYVGILAIWPFRLSTRFWIALIPFLIGWGWLSFARFERWTNRWQWAKVVAAAGFVSVGLVLFGYHTRISLSGERFPEVCAHGLCRDAFAAAKSHAPLSKLDPKIARKAQVLRRFEASCR